MNVVLVNEYVNPLSPAYRHCIRNNLFILLFSDATINALCFNLVGDWNFYAKYTTGILRRIISTPWRNHLIDSNKTEIRLFQDYFVITTYRRFMILYFCVLFRYGFQSTKELRCSHARFWCFVIPNEAKSLFPWDIFWRSPPHINIITFWTHLICNYC